MCAGPFFAGGRKGRRAGQRKVPRVGVELGESCFSVDKVTGFEGLPFCRFLTQLQGLASAVGAYAATTWGTTLRIGDTTPPEVSDLR